MVFRKSSVKVKFSLFLILFFSLFFFFIQKNFSFAQSKDLIIQNYQLVSKSRVGRTIYEYTFKADIANIGTENFSNVTATVTSLAPTIVVVDNSLTFGNVPAGSTVTSIDTFSIRIDRQFVFNESNLIWNIQYAKTSISVGAGFSVMNIPVGTSANIAYTVNFETNTSNTYNIGFTQSVSPNIGGISLSTDFPPGWTTNTSKSWVVNETITGNIIGSYELTTLVTINKTSKSDKITTIVNVISDKENPVLNPLSSYPDAISISKPTDVLFTTLLLGTDLEPTEIVLEEVDSLGNPIGTLGRLVDDGTNGDLTSNDKVYSGTFNINSNTEGELYYRAKANFPGIITTAYSKIYKLGVSRFPTGIQPSDMSKIVTDSQSGGKIISNEVLVSFAEGTNPDTIEEIVNSIGGTIVGMIFGLNTYQILISNNSNTVNETIYKLLSFPEVESAEPVTIGSISAVTPNDTDFSSQWGLIKIRADEAWVTARGNTLIAILDTGVDYNHPDLDAKIIKGKNYITGTNDPRDDNGHGTHVSGIAAAETNNGVGIAGVSWNSKILSVKVCDANGDCPKSSVADGIKYASDIGAKIINLSLRYDSDFAFKIIPIPLFPYFIIVPTDSVLKKAVDYANSKGSLIVVASGNDGDTFENYPAAYPNVLSVGNTTQDDSRNTSSNYGDWVRIAAPGTDIYSTMPTYHVTLNNPPYNISQNYGYASGTSMASPMVAGAAAVVWSKHPSWTAAQVRERLEKTAKPLPGQQLGAGRIDLFEAVFNGSFELDNLSEWTYTGTASSLTSLGPLVPQDRNGHKKRMGYVSTGPSANRISSTLSQTFTILPGVTSLPISFDYNFVTEEYPEWVGTIYNDALLITLQTPSGETITLASEEINTSAFVPVEGIDFPGGDYTVGMTGWKTVTVNVPVTEGPGTYKIFITDAGDDIYDSVVLIDNIRFK
ncbi:MAG: S8 family serine peptidase [Nitrososphaeria archaeon]